MKEQSQSEKRIFIWNSAFLLLFVVIMFWIRLFKNIIGIEVSVILIIVFMVLFVVYVGIWFEIKAFDLIKTDKAEKKFELVKRNVIKYSWSLAIEWESETEEIDEKKYNELLQAEDFWEEQKRVWIIIREVEK